MSDVIKLCKVPGCGKPKQTHKSALLCGTHLHRWRTYKSYDAPIKILEQKVTICNIEGCHKPRCQRRLICAMHAQRMRMHSSYELLPKKPRKKTKKTIIYPIGILYSCKIHGDLTADKVCINKTKDRWMDGTIIRSHTYRCLQCEIPKRKASVLKKKYNMTPEEYDRILIMQNEACAICKKNEKVKDSRTGIYMRLSVDHCHKTNLNRGLLCLNCNILFGHAKESIEILQNAIEYAKVHNV